MQREGRGTFRMLFALNFLLTSGFFLGRTARDALFYSTAGAERLPWAFIINAAVIFVVGGWIARAQDRFSLKKMMCVSWGVSTLCVAGFGLFFEFDLANEHGFVPYFVFFAFFEIPYLALIGLFWSFAETYFTERQADEKFPKITGGAHLGTILAGLIAVFATAKVGTAGLIFIWGGMTLAGLILIIAMWKYAPPPRREGRLGSDDAKGESEEVRTGFAAGVQAVLRHRYAGIFAAITFFTFFVMSVFDYALADTAKTVLGEDTDKLTVYLGYITVAFGVVAFFVQMLLVPRLLSKMAVDKANLIAPSLLTLGGGVLLTTYGFASAAIARGLFLVNEFVFNQTLLPFIYGAVPERDRAQIRSTIEGTVTNVALAVAGVFLIFPAMVEAFQPHWLGQVAFFAAAAMLGLSIVLGRYYYAIRGKGSAPGDFAGQAGELRTLYEFDRREFDKELRRYLSSGSQANVLLALSTVRQCKVNGVFEYVVPFVDDSNDDVRLAALDTMRIVLSTEEQFESFLSWVQYEGTSRVRRFKREDLSTLAAIAKIYQDAGKASEIGDDFQYLVDSEWVDTQVQGLAARLILRMSGAVGPIQHTLQVFESAIESEDLSRKTMAAATLGELGYDKRHFAKLCEWLDCEGDQAAVLRHVALEALVGVGVQSRSASEEIVSILVDKLTEPSLRREALVGGARVVAAHASLVSVLQSRWEFEEKRLDSVAGAITGVLPMLPLLLERSNATEAEILLLAMVEQAEHQAAKTALRTLDLRARSMYNVRPVVPEDVGARIREGLLERLCVCGKLRSEVAEDRIVQDSLTYRLQDLFRQYCRVLYLAYRTESEVARMDRDIPRLESKSVFVRDDAVKSLEIVFRHRRSVYREMDSLVDSLDFQKTNSEQEARLAQLSSQKGYDWHSRDGKEAMARLFAIKKDLWLLELLTRYGGRDVAG